MRKDLINKYVWIVDTIQKHGTISRKSLNELWLKSAHSDGHPIPTRTFFTYRRDIEQCFNIEIECNNVGEYYIVEASNQHDKAFINWMLDSFAMKNVVADSKDINQRILIDEIPSARQHLPAIIEALKNNKKITFTYKGYTRTLPEQDILLQPYMLKLYRQRWYVIGLKESEKIIKTYALDRIQKLSITDKHFTYPQNINPATHFNNFFGITTSKADVKRISIQTTTSQAKYFRALPLHHSQMEEIHDNYSIFTYKLVITRDFLMELLSYGSQIKIIAPTELRIMLTEELKKTLQQYQK